MFMESLSLYAVEEILGHADIKTTQRDAHLSPEYMGKEIGKLGNCLLKPIRHLIPILYGTL